MLIVVREHGIQLYRGRVNVGKRGSFSQFCTRDTSQRQRSTGPSGHGHSLPTLTAGRIARIAHALARPQPLPRVLGRIKASLGASLGLVGALRGRLAGRTSYVSGVVKVL